VTPWWAVGLILLGVVLDRWLPRAMHQADQERQAQQLRPFGPAPSNCRVVHRPELYDQEADGG
jgi:hypothetical protein